MNLFGKQQLSKHPFNRRSFLQATLALVGVATLLPKTTLAEGKRGGGSSSAASNAKPKLVDPKSSDAKAVFYAHHIKDVKEKSVMTERQGVKFLDQKCKSCVFYDATKETTVDGLKAGPCQMPFAKDKVVSADGFCSTWAKKS